METANHLALAKYLIATVNHPILNRHQKAFLLGNVSPDINLFTYFSGHKFESFHHMVRKKLIRLMNKECWNWFDVYELGKVTHYLADYFTYPHNQEYDGNLAAHYQYEKRLHLLITAYLSEISKTDPAEIFLQTKKDELLQYINSLHQEYVKKWTSIHDDCYYIVSISSCVLKAISI